MSDLERVALPFIEMAHRIVWCSAASVDRQGRSWSRILHPFWEFQDGRLVGWVGTGPTPIKRDHLEASPYLSLSYWDPSHDTCVAQCRASWFFDDETRTRVWESYKALPPPLGFDPAMIPAWDSPTCDAFAALRLEPWRLRVFPGTMLLKGEGEVLTWREGA